MMNTMSLPSEIKSESDVHMFFKYLLEVDKVSFHPDTPFSEYVDMESGRPSFSPEEAAKREQLMDASFELLGDGVYEIGVELFTRHMGLNQDSPNLKEQ